MVTYSVEGSTPVAQRSGGPIAGHSARLTYVSLVTRPRSCRAASSRVRRRWSGGHDDDDWDDDTRTQPDVGGAGSEQKHRTTGLARVRYSLVTALCRDRRAGGNAI